MGRSKQEPVFLTFAGERFITQENFGSLERNEPSVLAAEERVKGFIPMDAGFNEAQSKDEAERCLQCDLRLQLAPQRFWNDYPIHTAKEGQA